VIIKGDRLGLYFYINSESNIYNSTLKDARSLLKVSKLGNIYWYGWLDATRSKDTTVYGYLTTLKKRTHGY